MRRYLSLYGLYVTQQLKAAAEYRANFFIGAAAALCAHGASLLALWVVMQLAPSLNGWTLPQIWLIYGLVVLARALSHIFTDNLWSLSDTLRDGGFDRFLVRPIDPLFQLLAERLAPGGVGDLLVGLALLIATGRALAIATPASVAYLAAAVLSGSAIFFALTLITSASAFWIIDAVPVTTAVFENAVFAQYPLSIYPRAVRFVLTWVIPFGLASFYPAAYLLGRDVGALAWLSPLVAAALLVIGYTVWRAGLRRYEGTGS
jgi:ABC-2 type transport system permease protein